MFTLFLSVIFLIASIVVWFAYLFTGTVKTIKTKIVSTIFLSLSIIFFLSGSISYNDSGKAVHVQTIFGGESTKVDVGWYFSGWGTSTEYPHQIDITHGSDLPPYNVRMADNWTGSVFQATRFIIPLDDEQFKKMHHDFRSPERLIASLLRPAVTSSLDSTANLFSMEEYYAGGKRDEFKNEYKNAVEKGRAKVRQIVTDGLTTASIQKAIATDDVEDTSSTNNIRTQRIVMEKITDDSGSVVREPHDYMSYGITVGSAIVETLDPDDKFESQIQARKDAASRRIVAQEQRREQEEQKLLAIQTGETDIAKRQAESKVIQIQKTTDAETDKQLAIIEANKIKEQANIAKETAFVNLEKAKLEAQTTKTLADAKAYEKKAVLEADGALEKKLEAWVQAQAVWADAAKEMNVPTNVFGGNSSTSGVSASESLMQMLSIKTAKDLAIDMSIKK